jgi:hypothetical protein
LTAPGYFSLPKSANKEGVVDARAYAAKIVGTTLLANLICLGFYFTRWGRNLSPVSSKADG